MPRIDNLNGLTLSDIIDTLRLDPNDQRELRSSSISSTKFSNLYVKERQAAITSLVSRKNHRDNAIALVTRSLKLEAEITSEMAQTILKNVLGEKPTQITVSDVIRLRNQARAARDNPPFKASVMGQEEGGGPHSGSFHKTAEEIEDTEHSQEGSEVANKINQYADELAKGDGYLVKVAFDMDGEEEVKALFTAMHTRMCALPPYASSSPEECRTWLNFALTLGTSSVFTAAQLRSLGTIQQQSMQAALAHQFKQLQGADTLEALRKQDAVARAKSTLTLDRMPTEMGDIHRWAHALAAGTATPIEIRFEIAGRKCVEALLAAMSKQMLALPPYESSTPEESKTWLNIAMTLSLPVFFTKDQLQTLPPEQKRSIHLALVDRSKALQGDDPVTRRERKAIVITDFNLDTSDPMAALSNNDTQWAHKLATGTADTMEIETFKMADDRERAAFSAAMRKEMSALPAYESSTPEQKRSWSRIARILIRDNFMGMAQWRSLPIGHQLSLQSALVQFYRHGYRDIFGPKPPLSSARITQLAHSLVIGAANPIDVEELEIGGKEDVEALFAAMRSEISVLPSYESSTPDQKELWFNITLTMSTPSLFTEDQLLCLPIEQNLSMHQALENHYLGPVGRNDTIHERAAIIRADVTLNNVCQLSELMSPEEKDAMDALFSDIGKNKIVCHAYAHWKAMDETQRKEVIQTLIDLHAEKFGYAKNKPTFELDHSDDPTSCGSFKSDGNRLVIFSAQKNFGTFGTIFNTLIHELTHRLQHELANRLRTHQIDPGEPQYLQARLFDTSTRLYLDISYLITTYDFSEAEAHSAYRSNLIEMHAFYWGNLAQAKVDTIFAPQALTGEKQ